MRPHGRARISARFPEALAICERCGFMHNLGTLSWQWDFQQGPRLKNLYKLVCPPCLDKPQENGRTIVLPPDPVPVANARPENYALADNPMSGVGYRVSDNFVPQAPQGIGFNVGTMSQAGGIAAAFDGNAKKPADLCAARAVSLSSFGNWVGKNWAGDPSGFTAIRPSSNISGQTMVVSSFTISAPNNARFLRTGATAYSFDGSIDGQTWTSLASGTTAGTVGETISGTPASAAPYQYHRVAISGDGVSAVAIAQAAFTTNSPAPNDI